MTQDEIIEMAMAYGFTGGFNAQGDLTYDATFVEAVTEAVAKTRKATLEEMIYAHPTTAIKQAVEYEREACAKTVEKIETYEKIEKACFKFAAKTIRARGEA